MSRRSLTRALATVAIALAALVLLPAVALAHASFDVRQVPAGSSQPLVLRVPLERDAVNDLVEVLVPGAFTVDTCDGAEGWSCTQDTTADGNTVLRFERAPDGPGDTEHFGLTVTAPQEEGVYPFPTIQTYDDGEEAAWIGEPGSDHPAPRIQVGDETTPVEFSGDATPHTASAEPSPDSTPSVAATDAPTEIATGSPDDGTPDDGGTPDDDGTPDDAGAGEVDDDGAAPVIAAIVIVVVIAALVAVVVARRRRE